MTDVVFADANMTNVFLNRVSDRCHIISDENDRFDCSSVFIETWCLADIRATS